MAVFKKSAEDAEKLLDEIDSFGPSKYPGMTYEQGIYETLLWLLEGEDRPEVK